MTAKNRHSVNRFVLSPAIKGQMTKALKAHRANMAEVTIDSCLNFAFGAPRSERQALIGVLNKHMPREQAKHYAKRYLASVAHAS